MKKNILVTGRPGVGKTTLVLKVTELADVDVEGFYTREVRFKGRRVGFELCTFDGEMAVLAHVDSPSRFRVGRYGVDVECLEAVGVAPIERGIRRGSLIVVDEIGRMELYSKRFREVVLEALDADTRVFASIGPQPIPFLQEIKSRVDCEVLEISLGNRDTIAEEIISRLSPI